MDYRIFRRRKRARILPPADPDGCATFAALEKRRVSQGRGNLSTSTSRSWWWLANGWRATAFPTAIPSGRTGTRHSSPNSPRAVSTGAYGWSRPARATRAELESFHTAQYVDLVANRSVTGEGYLDAGDTPAWRGVYEAAADVVGATLLAAEEIMAGRVRRAFVPIAGLHHRGARWRGRFLRLQRLRRRGRDPAEQVRTAAHRLRRHRCAPWRRRVLRLRERSGPDLRRHARGRSLPVSGHGTRGRDRPRCGGRHQAQHSGAAGCRRRGVRGRVAAGARPPAQARAGVHPAPVRRRQRRGRPDHPHALFGRNACARRAGSGAAWPSGSAMGACSGTGGGGYNRINLAQAWSGVVQGLLEYGV